MILVDSLYINNGGGKILLDYIVEKLEERTESVYYIFDKRCENDFSEIPFHRKIYMESSLLIRHKFYTKNQNKFSSILCFGNLAPTIKLNIPVYTYFHQPMFLNVPKEFGILKKVVFTIKTIIFRKLLKNTCKLIVQNEFMKNKCLKKFGLKEDEIICIPFYPNEDLFKFSNIREENTFFYVSNATPHKNHLRLIEAFKKFHDNYKTGKLIVTVSENYKKIYNLIEDLKSFGYPIVNLGFVDREELIYNYHKSEYLIFPSLEESFGLGIVEAIDCGCKVIGSDLAYLHEVCRPSITFDPHDTNRIFNSFINALNKKVQPTVKKINNDVDILIDLLIQ